VSESPRSEHYSYAVYRDPETASSFDEKRFGGPIGEIVADTQARVMTEFIGPVPGRRILDVGTGTGRAAVVLAAGGGIVTAVDASEEMLDEARAKAAAQSVAVAFDVGDAHALQFSDRSFDVVVSLRVLMHTPGWRQALSEMCRVSNELVIFDYPSRRSFAALQAGARAIASRLGARTEAYRVFSTGQIARELSANGFRIRSVHRLFVLPIALHKTIGSRPFTASVERLLAGVGLLRAFGSPVTVVAERCASS
jgi:2-polyprenyl-3-methyl-5-hydroxy-6-metoxy-1,4-benzoquinol methylase